MQAAVALALLGLAVAAPPAKHGAKAKPIHLRASQGSGLDKAAAQIAKVEKIEAAVADEPSAAAAALSSCGALKDFPNAKPANFKDARKTKYDKELKKEVPVVFNPGDKIEFKCERGFTVTGAKDADTAFEVECSEHGYFVPSKVCVKVSPCGDLPVYEHATPTGKITARVGMPTKFQYACDQGHSLDGEKVIPGGFGKNQFFEIECTEFTAQYTKFEGTCKAYSFVPTGQMIKMYNKVFEALFTVSCKGTIKKAFGKGDGPPGGLEAACGKFDESQGDCNSLVSGIKSDFEAKASELKDYKKESKKEWYDEDPDAPNVNDEAQAFCEKMWKLVEMPSLLQSP